MQGIDGHNKNLGPQKTTINPQKKKAIMVPCRTQQEHNGPKYHKVAHILNTPTLVGKTYYICEHWFGKSKYEILFHGLWLVGYGIQSLLQI